MTEEHYKIAAELQHKIQLRERIKTAMEIKDVILTKRADIMVLDAELCDAFLEVVVKQLDKYKEQFENL